MTAPRTAEAGPPAQIYLIRHGEKPGEDASSKRADFGVDVDGNQSRHGLLPRGWQRSGALVVLFAPAVGALRAGLRTPTALYSPDYGSPKATKGHRTYQTIEGLGARLAVPIATPHAVDHEAELAAAVLAEATETVLICWDHERILTIAAALPMAAGTHIPDWPGDRFDMIWSFTLRPGIAPDYVFSQLPQLLLDRDSDVVF
jgi:hypothetical protein